MSPLCTASEKYVSYPFSLKKVANKHGSSPSHLFWSTVSRHIAITGNIADLLFIWHPVTRCKEISIKMQDFSIKGFEISSAKVNLFVQIWICKEFHSPLLCRTLHSSKECGLWNLLSTPDPVVQIFAKTLQHTVQGKSEGFDNCDRPRNLTQIGIEWVIDVHSVWPSN